MTRTERNGSIETNSNQVAFVREGWVGRKGGGGFVKRKLLALDLVMGGEGKVDTFSFWCLPGIKQSQSRC